jgi:uncharacterized membrane protein YecN with MAPEG domain
MSFRTVASANGVVSVAFGAAALAVPAVLTSLYGADLTDREAWLVRLLGASYLGLGIVAWAARGVTDAAARAAIAAGAVAAWSLSLPVSVLSQLAGHTSAVGWTTPALQIAFALAWTFVLLEGRRGSAPARV